MEDDMERRVTETGPKEILPPQPSEGASPADTLFSASGPPTLWDDKPPLF